MKTYTQAGSPRSVGRPSACAPIYSLPVASLPAMNAVGIYAKTRSVAMNQVGAGIIAAATIPPIIVNAPIPNANHIFLLVAMVAATSAPTNEPSACARKGIRKWIGVSIGIAAVIPSTVVISAPAGGGMIEPLIIIIPIFAMIPAIMPAITARMFLTIGFIFVFLGAD